MRILAKSSRFQVQSGYEIVNAIDRLTGASFSLGDHYVDPDEAYITNDGQWILVFGDGVTARHTYGPGPLIELFRQGCAPAAQDLAEASPPDPDYPGNPFPEELYPIGVMVLSVSSNSAIRLSVRPVMHTPSIWLLVLKRDGSFTLNQERSQ